MFEINFKTWLTLLFNCRTTNNHVLNYKIAFSVCYIISFHFLNLNDFYDLICLKNVYIIFFQSNLLY